MLPIVCSLKDNLALHSFSIESEVFLEGTAYIPNRIVVNRKAVLHIFQLWSLVSLYTLLVAMVSHYFPYLQSQVTLINLTC